MYAAGNRLEKNGVTNYQYVNAGNNQVLVTKNMTAGTSTFNVYGNDLISQGGAASTSRQYYLTDGLGNVKYLTNSSGTLLNTYSYDPWGGNQTTSGTTANSYVYQAEQKDSESSLVYLRARYYDPSIGRFTSTDPSSGTLDNPLTQNGYNYADNDPINLMDPLGLAAQCGTSGKQQSKLPIGFALGSVIVGKGNQNDFRKMGDSELAKYGIDAHGVKQDIVLKNVAKYDIYLSKSTGDLYIAQKGLPRGSELQPINMRISTGNVFNVAPGESIPDMPIDNLPVDVPDIPL